MSAYLARPWARPEGLRGHERQCKASIKGYGGLYMIEISHIMIHIANCSLVGARGGPYGGLTGVIWASTCHENGIPAEVYRLS